jgi:hypothetical protein
MISAHNLGYYLSQSLHFSNIDWSSLVVTPINFGVTGSKVKFTGAINFRMVSAFYLGYFLSRSLHDSHIDSS